MSPASVLVSQITFIAPFQIEQSMLNANVVDLNGVTILKHRRDTDFGPMFVRMIFLMQLAGAMGQLETESRATRIRTAAFMVHPNVVQNKLVHDCTKTFPMEILTICALMIPRMFPESAQVTEIKLSAFEETAHSVSNDIVLITKIASIWILP